LFKDGSKTATGDIIRHTRVRVCGFFTKTRVLSGLSAPVKLFPHAGGGLLPPIFALFGCQDWHNRADCVSFRA
jgi:hypothetical protein